MTVIKLKYDSEYGGIMYEYSSPIYLVESYLLAYTEPIMLVPLELE